MKCWTGASKTDLRAWRNPQNINRVRQFSEFFFLLPLRSCLISEPPGQEVHGSWIFIRRQKIPLHGVRLTLKLFAAESWLSIATLVLFKYANRFSVDSATLSWPVSCLSRTKIISPISELHVDRRPRKVKVRFALQVAGCWQSQGHFFQTFLHF